MNIAEKLFKLIEKSGNKGLIIDTKTKMPVLDADKIEVGRNYFFSTSPKYFNSPISDFLNCYTDVLFEYEYGLIFAFKNL